MLRQRGWLGGWLGVRHTPVLYQNGYKHILIPFRPSGSPVILVSSKPCIDTQLKGEPLKIKNTRGEIGDFRRKSPVILETVRERPMVTMER